MKKKRVIRRLSGAYLTGALEMPGDVLLDMPVIRIDGCGRLLCENHKGVLEYGGDLIRFATSLGSVCVRGSGMVIAMIDGYSLVITGRVQGVEYPAARTVKNTGGF